MQPRLWTLSLLAWVAGSVLATNAGAIDYQFSTPYAGGQLFTSDTLVVDVVLNADLTGISASSLGILYDPTVFAYDPGSSSTPGTASYAGFAYALYDNNGRAAYYLVPGANPPQTWPAPPTGLEQINIMWSEANAASTTVTGTFTAATLVFHALTSQTVGSSIEMTLSAGGNLFVLNGINCLDSCVDLDAPIVVTPEPSTALLIGVGLVAVGLFRRARS